MLGARLVAFSSPNICWGLGEDDIQILSQGELESRIRLNGVREAYFSPHAAMVNPGLMVLGLARSVESLGGTIFEQLPGDRDRTAAGGPPGRRCAPSRSST